MIDNTTTTKDNLCQSLCRDKTGVLLINLGTPASCKPTDVRAYLAEFLSDRRVIELSPWLWLPVLYGIILTTRPARVARAYAKIWREDTNESPLLYYTRRTSEKIQNLFMHEHQNKRVFVDYAMRYGKPSISSAIQRLQQNACDRVLILPLYPQYSATTTATAVDKVNAVLAELRWQPVLRFVPPYYEHPAYIQALTNQFLQDYQTLSFQADAILFSFHGLPADSVQKGDPYYCHCLRSAQLLTQRLTEQLPVNIPCYTAFQSRFGPKQWLAPYANEKIIELARQGVKNLVVLAPGFAADCLETIEEMGMQNRDVFLQHGGKNYCVLPCLNDSSQAIDCYKQILSVELAGW